jgi:hypothetical protein
MPWKGIGVVIAVIVASLIVLGRASGFVVDWAWFWVCRRLLDGLRRESRSLHGRLRGIDLASLGERNAGITVCVTATPSASGSP